MKDMLTEMVSFRVSARERQSLEQIAAREDRKLADVVRRLFRRGLLTEERKTGGHPRKQAV